MKKLIIAGIAVVGLSMAPAWAIKYPHHASTHHAKQPAASTAPMAAQTSWPFGAVSDADKAMYARNKRESGVK